MFVSNVVSFIRNEILDAIILQINLFMYFFTSHCLCWLMFENRQMYFILGGFYYDTGFYGRPCC